MLKLRKSSGLCINAIAQCKMLLFYAKTIVGKSQNFELARLKKEVILVFGDFLVPNRYFRSPFCDIGKSTW